jgi:hypothetical protein
MKSYIPVVLVFLVISFFISCTKENSQADIESELLKGAELNCDKEKIKTIVIINELAKIKAPKESPVPPADLNKIHKLVERLKDREDLTALAEITWALRSNSSGELECTQSCLIPVFEEAFWHCITILAADRSEENLMRMRLLKEKLNIGDASGYNWSTIVDRIPMP